MLDVHPPHHAAGTWRDFLIHIATIVVGLLIAIGLEQGVETLHHRHLAREARENLRQELVLNQKQAIQNKADVQADVDRMEANLVLARKLRLDANAIAGQTMHFTITWSSFNDSAWRSARDSGALTYMPAEEVQRYDDCYVAQDIVNKQALEIFTLQTVASAPLSTVEKDAVLTQEERNAFASALAVVKLRLLLLQQILAGLDKNYETTLRE